MFKSAVTGLNLFGYFIAFLAVCWYNYRQAPAERSWFAQHRARVWAGDAAPCMRPGVALGPGAPLSRQPPLPPCLVWLCAGSC